MSKTILTRLSAETMQAVERYANAECRSIAGFVRAVITAELARRAAAEAPKGSAQ